MMTRVSITTARLERRAGAVLICLLAFLPATLAAGELQVVTVPFLLNSTGYHESFDGGTVILQGTVNLAEGCTLTAASWDPGDGSPAVAAAADNPRVVEASHIYAAKPGRQETLYTAHLTATDSCGNSGSGDFTVIVREKNLNVERYLAIDRGLWNLHREMTTSSVDAVETGYWTEGTGLGGYPEFSQVAAATASAVLAFEVNGHFEFGNRRGLPDPYQDDVARGLAHVLSMLVSVPIAPQEPHPGDNPDTNGNGLALGIPDGLYSNYVTGQIVDALVGSCTPDSRARLGEEAVRGRTYAVIVQDMIDLYAWSQVKDGWARGGWRYNWNSESDNSACQWAAIAGLAVERARAFKDRVSVPPFLKTENVKYWLPYSQNFDDPLSPVYGMFGYTGPGGNEGGLSTTPAGMLQLILDGLDSSDPDIVAVQPRARFRAAEGFLERSWPDLLNLHRIYGMYSTMKALTLAVPPIVRLEGGLDWFFADTQATPPAPVDGLVRHLVKTEEADPATQEPSGRWDGGGWVGTGSPLEVNHLATAWAVTILTRSIIVPPVAVCHAEPEVVEHEPITLDGRNSHHLDPGRNIVRYEWDCDGDGKFDDGNGPTVDCTPAAAGPYHPCLRVTDDNDPPLTDTACCDIRVLPAGEHRPPNSDPGGPYCFCIGVHQAFTLDGSKSSASPSRPEGKIVKYQWSFSPHLDGSYDAEGGFVVATDYFSRVGPGTYTVELKVVDDLQASDVDWTTVTVSDRANCSRSCPISVGQQVPGDANQDGKVDVSDAVWLLDYLFQGGGLRLPCEGGTADTPGAGELALLDWNGDGILRAGLDISDPIGLLGWLFTSDRPPHVLGSVCIPIAGCPQSAGCPR
jgi:hypothetical protein